MSQRETTNQPTSCAPGQPRPIGASCMTLDGMVGVNFAVYSQHAERIDVCLYDEKGKRETARITLSTQTDDVWHGFVAGLSAGQFYGLRAHGPYQPKDGQRFNPAKLLIDPYARALCGDLANLSLERDYLDVPSPDATVLDALPDPSDNAARIPKARVLNWSQERQAGARMAKGPRIPLDTTVLYEAHVKGLTQCHPDVPEPLRGTYAGLVSPPMLAHYRKLGITTLCLLPVHLHITEAHLLKKDLCNYWGYNTLGFFVPHPGYASTDCADVGEEFRFMVDQLHHNGLEVVLDVVFNHSAESDTFGPTLSWRGLDNASWYALDTAGQYINHSGCGNSFNLAHPCAIQWVMDCLRWWVEVYGVDGFRFDLATALGRDPVLAQGFHPHSALLSAIAQDPVLAQVKLIAEPWDIGPGGYQLGHFPAGWHEWNDRYRDTTRAFWLGHGATRGDFVRRLTGSGDLFQHEGRSPLASINLVATHDGMTLADLTAYCHKHNATNGEDNRDGHNHNLSANGGVEGPSADPEVNALRGKWRRALLCTLFVSQGVPQLLAGDEWGNSQGGNNNAYCQDNATSWLDWNAADQGLLGFCSQLIALRQSHAALRHAHWFSDDKAIVWRSPSGHALSATEWEDPQACSFACVIDLSVTGVSVSHRWLLAFHAGVQEVSFALPPGPWRQVLDSAHAVALPQSNWEQAPCYSGTVVAPAHCVQGLVQATSPAPTNHPLQ
ncbi:glycogen debranching protein GlgX [Candidatus Aalborgicola defluviihabitans]|uniref:glycogen debranching protein GlgX n=1 Tax=Candidatus Aalborgicola defluviihabitans TaxID=3386187 RepID=UPI001E10BDB7|nr:glycogen debranching protein GlgX [Burkholderiales bacterium]